jgi:Flp pilus assembly protein TadD
MDSDGVLELLRPEEWLALRRELEGGTRNVSRDGSDADWHDARARDAEQDGDTYGALWHLDRLVKERPAPWVVHARRARVLKQAGRVEEAGIEQDRARQLGADTGLLDW